MKKVCALCSIYFSQKKHFRYLKFGRFEKIKKKNLPNLFD